LIDQQEGTDPDPEEAPAPAENPQPKTDKPEEDASEDEGR